MSARKGSESARPSDPQDAPAVLTPARDALEDARTSPAHFSAEADYGWGCGWAAAIDHALANPDLVLAALVEAHGRHEVMKHLGCVGWTYPTNRKPSRFISALFPNTDPATFPKERNDG